MGLVSAIVLKFEGTHSLKRASIDDATWSIVSCMDLRGIPKQFEFTANARCLQTIMCAAVRPLFLCWWLCIRSTTLIVLGQDKVIEELTTQIVKLMESTWGLPGSCRPHLDPMLALCYQGNVDHINRGFGPFSQPASDMICIPGNRYHSTATLFWNLKNLSKLDLMVLYVLDRNKSPGFLSLGKQTSRKLLNIDPMSI